MQELHTCPILHTDCESVRNAEWLSQTTSHIFPSSFSSILALPSSSLDCLPFYECPSPCSVFLLQFPHALHLFLLSPGSVCYKSSIASSEKKKRPCSISELIFSHEMVNIRIIVEGRWMVDMGKKTALKSVLDTLQEAQNAAVDSLCTLFQSNWGIDWLTCGYTLII